MTNDAATVIRVKLSDEAGVWHASSNDLAGLHVCGLTVEVTCQRVLKAIKAIYKHGRGMDVEVIPATTPDEFPILTKPCDHVVVRRIHA